MKKQMTFATLVATAFMTQQAYAGSVDLASVMDGDGLISENAVVGTFAQINLDPDGLYNLANPSQQFGTADVFPNETSFGIGTLDYDDTGLTGVGLEVAAITGLDTSDLWADGSSTSDISDTALDIWFFGTGNSVVIDNANGTVTLQDGQVVGISLAADATITVDHGFAIPSGPTTVEHEGSFTINGNQVSLQVNDAVLINTVFGSAESTVFADLTGTVTAVVPEPSSLSLLVLGGLAMARRRRK
ncbi:MAG: PEP-CTERM sorting domain-containing protein [Planctomycetota bacterium]